MARQPRKRSASGVYHAMVRGINRQDLFLAKDDFISYLDILHHLKKEVACVIYGYCLMDNHVHLLLKEETDEEMRRLMHRLSTTYALRYCEKYEWIGHVHQGRFLSEPVETDRSLLAVLRYVHQNPVKAGMAATCSRYPYTSHHAYLQGRDPYGIAEVELPRELAGGASRLLAFLEAPSEDQLEPAGATLRGTDAELKEMLLAIGWEQQQTPDLNAAARATRDRLLRRLKANGSFSCAQIARVTGLSKATVARA